VTGVDRDDHVVLLDVLGCFIFAVDRRCVLERELDPSVRLPIAVAGFSIESSEQPCAFARSDEE